MKTAVSGVSEQDEAIVPGVFIGRDRTGSVFDAAFESGVDLGFPVVIKYAGRNIDIPYHPLMNEFAIHNDMADTGATLRMMYLSPVMKSHNEMRFIVLQKGGIAISEYAALLPNHLVPVLKTLYIANKLKGQLKIFHARGLMRCLGSPVLLTWTTR